ncbi:protein kinase [Nocardia nova]|uniref:Protein kinase n=1 Tax=Nocardia nova TaxID=37330 RepID=A0A2S6AIH5_9NOCA|nr:protein kinase [Nocardia nova]PPJ23722.1 protein kinase [Nocardia nova]PPJ35040.1 protein kinase [Nocardia nova]
MAEVDPHITQRDVCSDGVAALRAVGFEDAEEIGRGGFGVVYRCVQPALDRTVAVKVLTGELDENRERFFREQRAMGRLTGHPNIVSVLQVGETETGQPYLVMQFHPRGSLDAWIHLHGPLAMEHVLGLGVRMAGALETAHRFGVLHRDVKPANILLTDYGQFALTDFGIAHIAGGFETATGTVTGSPAFTAPEVLGGETPSAASDVYALGATLFCALTGRAAFERRRGEQVVAQFLRITTQPVPDLRESGVPADVCAAIEVAMSRDPHDRPSAVALGEQLQRVQLAHGFEVEQMALRDQPLADEAADDKPMPSVRGGDLARLAESASRELGNLPLDLNSFVGRRALLSQVKTLLSECRLVTLTGMGGVGKTRLALRAARRIRQGFSGGAWLVELGELREDASLVDVVGAAVGLRSPVGRPMLELLVEFCSTRAPLLVLDNCEQVIDAVAELAESLLQACPQVRILATSREALGIDGEAVLPVPPLAFPDPTGEPSLRAITHHDAVVLFAERAVAVVPGFELTKDNTLGVARICARLDGLPLAIELAAARLRTMSIEQILQRLTDRYALLTRGSRRAPTRQQTLRWCIGWSYDLCKSAEQRLWRQLSVFAGSFELDAAEAVCDADLAESDFLDSLSALVDKSILIREEADGAVRFRMLETVQEYGRDKIEEAGEQNDLRRRHRDWYERWVRDTRAEWISPRQLDHVARLETELPNLRKAMEFSLAEAGEHALRIAAGLFPFWLLRGRLSEGRRWCDSALARSSGAPTADRADVLLPASMLAALQGDLSVAASRVAELNTVAEHTAATRPLAIYADGFVALLGGDPARARTRLDEALDLSGASTDLFLQLAMLVDLGWAHELRGDTASALTCYERVLTTAESHGESVFREYALWGTGLAVWRNGQRERAAQMLRAGLRSTLSTGDSLTAAACLEILAWIAGEQHEARRAAVLMGAADTLGHLAGSSAVLFPHLLVHHEECEQRVREALGSRAFGAAHREGTAMSFRAAVGFALGEGSRAVATGIQPSTNLTKRERQIADLVAEGLTDKAIAARLVISLRTAQGHVGHILAKLGFTSRAQIATWVVEQAAARRSMSAQ